MYFYKFHKGFRIRSTKPILGYNVCLTMMHSSSQQQMLAEQGLLKLVGYLTT